MNQSLTDRQSFSNVQFKKIANEALEEEGIGDDESSSTYVSIAGDMLPFQGMEIHCSIENLLKDLLRRSMKWIFTG